MRKKGKPYIGIEYYHFLHHYCGNRYFKVDREKKEVTQIIVDCGEKKRGRPYRFGVVKIQLSSFYGTYYWHYGKEKEDYLIKYVGCKPENVRGVMKWTTENQFNKAFDLVTKSLITQNYTDIKPKSALEKAYDELKCGIQNIISPPHLTH